MSGRVRGQCWSFGGDKLSMSIAWNNGSYSHFGRTKIDSDGSGYTLQGFPGQFSHESLEAKGRITEDGAKYGEECFSDSGLLSTTASISELTFSDS